MNDTEHTDLDLHDIQGNIVKAYSRYGYPKGRYVLLRVKDGQAGRDFFAALTPMITTAAPWTRDGADAEIPDKPDTAVNVAISFAGLRALGLSDESLLSFPDEFVMGMTGRRDILGDDGPSAPPRWDPVWREPGDVHVLMIFNGSSTDAIERRYQDMLKLATATGGVEVVPGHSGAGGRRDLPYQEASAIYDGDEPTPKEHFGYTDGISNPYFKGSGEHPSNVIGGGKITGEPATKPEGWAPLETGEFLLGYKDEAFEFPVAPSPHLLARNGTYLVYRKLHENVGSFNRYLDEWGPRVPEGKEWLAAKFAGRWRSGAPVTTFRTEEAAEAFGKSWAEAKNKIVTTAPGPAREAAKREFAELNTRFVAFDYNQDISGGGCPLGAHVRRANPRGALEFGETGAFATPGALADRRRIMRRGLPYGKVEDPTRDDGDHGIVFMALCASIKRQFEFVQQQWINYGNDFRLASERDAILGNHGQDASGKGTGQMVIQADPSSDEVPTFCSGIPRFVETRGGEYFFVPSITALRMIGEGIVDPT